MSSPIALKTRGIIKNTLVKLHQRLSHSSRVAILSEHIADIISEEGHYKDNIYCLDVGCGDMEIAENIHSINPKTIWSCIDVHELPESLKDKDKWIKYKRFDGIHIPFDDKSMDFVLFCDVLHHAKGNALMLLKEASRVGKIVVVKDHFEYSFYSRFILKAMDFVGNWGYGIELPDKYFTKNSFEEICTASGLKIKRLDTGINLYSHIPILKHVLHSKWHFIAVLIPHELWCQT